MLIGRCLCDVGDLSFSQWSVWIIRLSEMCRRMVWYKFTYFGGTSIKLQQTAWRHFSEESILSAYLHMCIILDTSAYSWIAAITFVMSVSVYQLDSHWTELSEIWYWSFSLKSVEEMKVFYNRSKISETLHWDLSTVYKYCCQRINFAFFRRLK
jgi:hypothetical protein